MAEFESEFATEFDVAVMARVVLEAMPLLPTRTVLETMTIQPDDEETP